MFAEVRFNLSDKNFLNTILIRLNDDYYVYDDYMKRYINMTSNSYKGYVKINLKDCLKK